MRRREFIRLIGGTATTWPFAARAQQTNRMRRVGVLIPQSDSDPVWRSLAMAFATRLGELGWIDGNNVRIEVRWANGDMTRIASLAKGLVEQQPDVLLAATGTAAQTLRQFTLGIPIVFTQVADPVASGLVTNLAHPEGNITGFGSFEYTVGGKWLEALKECSPGLGRVALLFDPGSAPWTLYVRGIETAARPAGVQLVPFPVQGDTEIEHAFTEFVTKPNGGIIVLPTGSTVARRGKIIALAAQYRLPAMYPFRFFVAEGGFMSYDYDLAETYRQAATYVDRILKGAKPVDLPVQQPTKFELVINLKTAKALGITIPQSLLATADEVIE
jgi:putative tryptophan/tyrosine transport system substrate-binding protein